MVELWFFATFGRIAVQLAEKEDGDAEPLGGDLHRPRDLGYLLVQRDASVGGVDEAEVVHDGEVALALPVEDRHPGDDFGKVSRPVIDGDGETPLLLDGLVEVVPIHLAGEDFPHGDLVGGIEDAVAEFVAHHLNGEEDGAVAELRGVLHHLQGHGGLADRGPRRHNDELSPLEPAVETGVQVGESRCDARHPSRRVVLPPLFHILGNLVEDFADGVFRLEGVILDPGHDVRGLRVQFALGLATVAQLKELEGGGVASAAGRLGA